MLSGWTQTVRGAIGLKNVTINDNFFPGHFPQRPIMPGVLMVEAMAQVGGLIMLDPAAAGDGGRDANDRARSVPRLNVYLTARNAQLCFFPVY